MSDKGFFSVGLDEWHKVCGLGMNEACIYLVQACGTGKTNLDTSWSVHACCNYTGISRGRSKKAQENILNSGCELMTQTKAGKHPRFKFIRAEDTELVWLPKTFIMGAENESPPLERARQTGDVMLLRLLVDLYAATNIADEGGVHRDVIFGSFERRRIGSYAEFEIFGFKSKGLTCCTNHPIVKPHLLDPEEKDRGQDFFARISTLTDLGLFNFVPYLMESREGEVLFPLIDPFTGETVDLITGVSETVLGESFATHINTFDNVIAIPKHFKSVALTGILFPRYRQQTELNAAGYEQTRQKIETWSKVFGDLEHAISRIYQRKIKGVSKDNQGLHQRWIDEGRSYAE